MAIGFTYYPTSNRVPGVYVEIDASKANTATVLERTLLIGQISSAGTAPPNVPLLVESQAQITAACGLGSVLEAMAIRYLSRDPFGPLYLLPLADAASSTPATGSVTINGTATASGSYNLYIAGQNVRVGVTTGMTSLELVTALADTIATQPALPVTAASNAGVLQLTAVNKGPLGNDIDIRLNYLGSAGGEQPVPGFTTIIAPMTGGAMAPLLDTALANLGSTPFDFIGMPYTDTASLDTMKNFLADDVGRWSWEQMVYGGCFSAFRGTLGACTAFGNARNDQHMSIIAFNDSPDPVWIWTAEVTAACAASLRVDPGLPLQYIATTLNGPPVQSQWTIGERNTLLYDGLSTFRVADDGTVIIERMATTYQKNVAGAADDAYLDVETLYGLMYVARDLSNYLLTRYARKKLVSDTTVITAGSNCVNAPMIKASTVFEYRSLEQQGYVQNSDAFAKGIVVENAGRGLIKILAPVDLVNQLRVIAILIQFVKS